MFSFQQGSVTVGWLSGGLWIETLGDALLLDAPSGCDEHRAAELSKLRGVVLSSGRLASVGGLVALLASAEKSRLQDSSLVLQTPPGDERSVLLAESWMRGWQGSYPLLLDTVTAGTMSDVGRFQIETLSVSHGEPRWLPSQRVESLPGVAIKVRVAGVTIVWVPGTTVSPACKDFVYGADLAVVEVGKAPWPRTERRWRMSVAEALSLSASASTAWIVGDDGSIVGGGDC